MQSMIIMKCQTIYLFALLLILSFYIFQLIKINGCMFISVSFFICHFALVISVCLSIHFLLNLIFVFAHAKFMSFCKSLSFFYFSLTICPFI
jgi:hypothetical protein